MKNSRKYPFFMCILIFFITCPTSQSQEIKATETLGYNDQQPFFKLSLAQWSLHRTIQEGRLSNLDFGKKAKELGFEGVEYVSQLYPLEEGNERESLERLAKTLKQRSEDYQIQNVLIMIDSPFDLVVSDTILRNKAIEDHKMWIDAAEVLGCASVRVNLFGDTVDTAVWHKNSVIALKELSTYAKTKQLNVIVENHGGFSSDADLLVDVLASVNMENCGALTDFGNFCVKREGGERWSGDCIENYDRYKGIAQLMPYAKGVSAKSYAFNKEGYETTIDYDRMLNIIKSSGFNGFIGVEYEGDSLNEEDGILATKALLMKLAKE